MSTTPSLRGASCVLFVGVLSVGLREEPRPRVRQIHKHHEDDHNHKRYVVGGENGEQRGQQTDVVGQKVVTSARVVLLFKVTSLQIRGSHCR